VATRHSLLETDQNTQLSAIASGRAKIFLYFRMILSAKRFPLRRIMQLSSHDLVGEALPTSPDHALSHDA
jgi:hypothetical protein